MRIYDNKTAPPAAMTVPPACEWMAPTEQPGKSRLKQQLVDRPVWVIYSCSHSRSRGCGRARCNQHPHSA